jgi:hypothetical protein
MKFCSACKFYKAIFIYNSVIYLLWKWKWISFSKMPIISNQIYNSPFYTQHKRSNFNISKLKFQKQWTIHTQIVFSFSFPASTISFLVLTIIICQLYHTSLKIAFPKLSHTINYNIFIFLLPDSINNNHVCHLPPRFKPVLLMECCFSILNKTVMTLCRIIYSDRGL